MKEMIVEDKKRYLEENYPFVGVPDLAEKRMCIHCGEIITVGDYKVLKGEDGFEYICCPNAPECNGTVIDWIETD
jgi:hypothetical protein